MGAFLKENWFKLGILLALLLVAWAIYTSLVVEPDKRRAADELKATQAEEQAQAAKDVQAAAEAAKQAELKKNLDSCLSDAQSAYAEQWYSECKSEGKISNKCIDFHNLTLEEYLAKYKLTNDEYAQQRGLTSTSSFLIELDYEGRWSADDCSCRLLLANADRINQSLKDSKDECFKIYPQN